MKIIYILALILFVQIYNQIINNPALIINNGSYPFLLSTEENGYYVLRDVGLKQIRIDDNYCIYNNLQDAFDDAVDGETIQILESTRTVPIYYNVTNTKEVTLDLNGYNITIKDF